MREILFKAKRFGDGEWVEGHVMMHDHDKATMFRQHPSDGRLEGSRVNPETVCQFTGLTDKNDVKIWEGDIVEGLLLFGLGINGFVEFKDGSYGLKWYRGGAEMFSPFAELCNITYKVIGNIFDDPDLMEGGAAGE